MRFIKVLALVILTFCLANCTIKERIVFKEDGTGSYLLDYDMSEFMNRMKSEMGAGSSSSGKDKSMDTIMVFKDIMESHKDSVAALPEDKRAALEAVKDMYMKMSMDEEKGTFNFGIGLDFKDVGELKNISDKIEKAKSLNSQNNQVDAMKGSPLGKFMGDDSSNLDYAYSASGFTRTTTLPENYNSGEPKFDENDESDKEFMEYFRDASYIVEYTFPKKIKSYSIKAAEISNDGRTITYKVSWLDFIENPTLLDIDLKFLDE